MAVSPRRHRAGLERRVRRARGSRSGTPPASWDEYIENARAVQRTGAAPYGCTFDPRGWRSLVPIAFTFDTDVYTEDGLFDYTHEAVVEALEIMRRMVELANPDVFDLSTTAGSGATTDEGAFASQLAGYYVKYTNALVRAANTWPDPSRLALSSVPAGGGPGRPLLDDGHRAPPPRREQRSAAAIRRSPHYDRLVWRDSIGTRPTEHRADPVLSLALGGVAVRTARLGSGVGVDTFRELGRGRDPPHRLGARQFTIAQPYLERYLTGEETNARRVLRRALAEVRKAAAVQPGAAGAHHTGPSAFSKSHRDSLHGTVNERWAITSSSRRNVATYAPSGSSNGKSCACWPTTGRS